MKFLFIDEVTYSQKNPNFLGVGAILIDSSNYVKFKENFYGAFNGLGWKLKIEFKGKYLFSQKGDSSVSVDKRIDFIHKIAESSKAKRNARYTFYFAYTFKGNNTENYILLLRSILNSISKPPSKKRDKNLIALHIDRRDDLKEQKLFIECNKGLMKKGYILLEKPLLISSSNLTPGIVTVDILCYLKSWDVLNPEDFSLFYSQLCDINKKKLEIIRKIISSLKNVKEIQS